MMPAEHTSRTRRRCHNPSASGTAILAAVLLAAALASTFPLTQSSAFLPPRTNAAWGRTTVVTFPKRATVVIDRIPTRPTPSSASSSLRSQVEEEVDATAVAGRTTATTNGVTNRASDEGSVNGANGASGEGVNGSSAAESRNGDVLLTSNGSDDDGIDSKIGGGGDDDLISLLKEKVFLGIDPSPEIIAIMTIYFVEGALGLARLAQTFLLKDTLHLGPAEMSALTGAFALPWTIKPLYGFLSDGFPLFGYRRRSYLIAAGLVGCLSYAALGSDFWGLLNAPEVAVGAAVEGAGQAAAAATGEAASAVVGAASTSAADAATVALSRPDLQWTIAALLLSSGCIALSDVVADGIVVQRTRDAEDPRIAGGLQSLCWGSAAVGGLITAYLSGSLLESMGPREVFAITAFLPACVAGIALLIDEEPVGRRGRPKTLKREEEKSDELKSAAVSETVEWEEEEEEEENPLAGVRSQIQGLYSAFRNPAVWRPALFLFLWQSTPTGEGAMLYFMTNDLGFGPEFLGRVRLVAAVSSLVGVWAYQKYLRTVPIRDILFWTSIASAPLGLSNLLLISHANRALGIPDGAFVFGDDVALSILGELAFLPTLVLAARLCPPGVEAVLFATLMSIFNGASTVGTELGAALTKVLGVTESNFDNLGLLTVICNLSSLYPLLFIGWLDDVGSKSEEEMEGEEGWEEGVVVLDVAAPPDMKGEH